MSEGVRVFVAPLLAPGPDRPRWPVVVPAGDLRSVRESLQAVDERVARRLCDDDGVLLGHIVVAHNGVVVTRSAALATVFADGDEVEFLAQVAGG